MLLLCTCEYRRCGESLDPETGERGIKLGLRNWKIHQKDELRSVAVAAQKRELKAQEESVTKVLERSPVPVDSEQQPSTRWAKDAKYRVDIKKKLLECIGNAMDQIDGLNAEIKAIGNPTSSSVTDEVVIDALEHCGEIRDATGDLAQMLRTTEHGSCRKDASVKELRAAATNALEQLLKRTTGLETSWKNILDMRVAQRQANLERGATEYDTAYHFQDVLGGARSVVQLTILMIVACHVILGLPRRGCYWLFLMVGYIVQVLAERVCNQSLPEWVMKMLDGFPRDIRTATDQFHLEGKSSVDAACPKCHNTHAAKYENDIPIYPERCTAKKHNSRCGEVLVRPKTIAGRRIYVPIKPYVAFNFKDWWAGMLSRNGYENMVDGAWKRTEVQGDGVLNDVFQGSYIKEFKGPDKSTHFSQAGGDGAGRYLFGLGFDFFNPLRNLAGGKKVSIGVVAIFCLNLPIELRYKVENIFLAGIIPGPHEPSLTGINPYLRRLVDTFLELWTGVYFSRTCLYPLGRLILCALILVICDLPAARKIAGLSACTHEYFCSICWCTRTQHTFDDFDYNSWKRRTNEECRRHAEKFRTSSAKEAASSFDKSGIRWSELLRLPYYDPTINLIVDPMHNLFLGLIKEHFQNILGYRPKDKDDDDLQEASLEVDIVPTEENPLPEQKSERASVRKLISLIQKPLDFDASKEASYEEKILQWSKPHLVALVYVGKAVGCLSADVGSDGRLKSLPYKPPLRKKVVAKELLSWRLKQVGQTPTTQGSSSNLRRGHVFTTEEMNDLWDDISGMIKPSWATSVPTTLSSFGPKLKSDQWRAVGTLYLPVTLIRLWSNSNGDGARRELLDLTMMLLSAISIASSRSTSNENADKYLQYMTCYRQELCRLFPTYKCHPNHHMAMHVGEFLRLYGPVHGWWTFPFERMIGMLQRIRTNYKPGEYEETIGRSWHRTSNFRALFTKASCPTSIRLCASMFEKLVRPQNHNNLASPTEDDNEDHEYIADSGSEKSISSDIYKELRQEVTRDVSVPKKARMTNRITRYGITYAVQKTHEGNSGILRHRSSVPYCIQNILQFSKESGIEEVWFVVQRYRKAEVEQDPYEKYSAIRAKMWSMELEEGVEVIPLSKVATHFAKRIVPWEGKQVAVVVSLSRVHIAE